MSIVINYINIKLYFKEGREPVNIPPVSTSGLCPFLQDVGHCGTAAVEYKTTRTVQRVELMARNIIFILYIHIVSLSSLSHKRHFTTEFIYLLISSYRY